MAPNPNKYRQPLHEIGQMDEPIELRLQWAREAVAAGRDVNEMHLSTQWRDHPGRPLHCALEHPGGWRPDERRYDGLELVRFLLDQGADPRLKDYLDKESPIDVARTWSEHPHKGSARKFYAEALKMMLARVKEIEGGI